MAQFKDDAALLPWLDAQAAVGAALRDEAAEVTALEHATLWRTMKESGFRDNLYDTLKAHGTPAALTWARKLWACGRRRVEGVPRLADGVRQDPAFAEFVKAAEYHQARLDVLDEFCDWLRDRVPLVVVGAAGKQRRTKPLPMPARSKLIEWWRGYVEGHEGAGTIPTGDDDLLAARAAFPAHTVQRPNTRSLRADKTLTPEAWSKTVPGRRRPLVSVS